MVKSSSSPGQFNRWSIEVQYADLSPEDRFIFDRIRQDQNTYHRFLSDLSQWNEAYHSHLAYRRRGMFGPYMYLSRYLGEHAEEYVGPILATRSIVRDMLEQADVFGDDGDDEEFSVDPRKSR